MSEGKVVVDISMPLDGFVTGPNPDVERGLGGGEPLHECNRKVLQEGIAEEGRSSRTEKVVEPGPERRVAENLLHVE